jgi:hypothetical protein
LKRSARDRAQGSPNERLKTLFAAVFLIEIAAAQTPPEKETVRKAEARRIHEAIDRERERLRFIGFPTLTLARPDPRHAAAAKENRE